MHVSLGEVPAAGPHHQRGGALAELVGTPVGTDVIEGLAGRVLQVRLVLHEVVPRRRERVFEVGHEHPGAGVQGVDHHLALDGPGDLDAPVLQVGRGRRHLPRAGADRRGVREKVGQGAEIDLRLAQGATLEKSSPRGTEFLLQPGDEPQRLRCQHPCRRRRIVRLELEPVFHLRRHAGSRVQVSGQGKGVGSKVAGAIARRACCGCATQGRVAPGFTWMGRSARPRVARLPGCCRARPLRRSCGPRSTGSAGPRW